MRGFLAMKSIVPKFLGIFLLLFYRSVFSAILYLCFDCFPKDLCIENYLLQTVVGQTFSFCCIPCLGFNQTCWILSVKITLIKAIFPSAIITSCFISCCHSNSARCYSQSALTNPLASHVAIPSTWILGDKYWHRR